MIALNDPKKSNFNPWHFRETFSNHPHLLAAHALTGCDSVPAMCGIGKKKAINALKSKQVSLISVGTNDLEKSYNESLSFVCMFACCMQKISQLILQF